MRLMSVPSRKQEKAEAKRKYHAHWRKRRGSSTPGGKGESCQATGLDKFFAKYSRARRHSGYEAWRMAHGGSR